MMEWHPVFKVGRSSLRVSFTGGHLCGGACTAASYETSDPVVQTVIEGSEAFRSKRIRLVYTEPETGSQPHSESNLVVERTPCASTESKTFEYSNEEDIYEYLEHTHGIPAEDLSTKGSCYDVAKRLGIELRKKT